MNTNPPTYNNLKVNNKKTTTENENENPKKRRRPARSKNELKNTA